VVKVKPRRRYGLAAVVGVLAASCGSFDAASTPDESGTPGADGGGPAPPAEDCLDGRDDNDDGKRDCEEPSCAAYVRCVPGPGALPEGWAGYVSLVENGDCPADAPSGSDVFAASVEPASCGACKCEASISCAGTVSLEESIVSTCQTVLPFGLTIGACGTIPDASGGPAKWWRMPNVGNATCTATTDPPTLPTKYRRARLCTGARIGAGCPSGQVCASSAGSGAAAGTCISRPHPGGAPVACPPAFPVAHLVAAADRDPESAFSEKRSCSACTCGKSTGASCNAVLSLYPDDTCTTVKATVSGTGCHPVDCGSKGCGSGRIDVTPQAGTCAAQSGAPTGSVELSGAGQQLCCDR
jgi:hypothetical protein